MHKDADTGLGTVDQTKCIGCGYCHMACPYNAPKVDREKGYSVKCSGCADRLAEGEQPLCVRACPARALQFGPVDEMKEYGEIADIAPLPSPSYTSPNFYIKECADARPSGDKDAMVANPLEVE
jgi:anaerobic dimethyl sulfoxide reductase subunit B (iron-sulfur subunit)